MSRPVSCSGRNGKTSNRWVQSTLCPFLSGVEELATRANGAGPDKLPDIFSGYFGILLDGGSKDRRCHPGRGRPLCRSDVLAFGLGAHKRFSVLPSQRER